MSSTRLPRVNGYEILRELGRGSMGAVYLARQSSLGREVAIKQLVEVFTENEHVKYRFMNEGRALGQIHHANVVLVYDLVLQDSDIFLVMEYVPGPNLRQLIDSSPVPTASALEIIRQVASAVAFINDIGIIHRDIKPENILVTMSGQCKLADFGIAKLLSGGDGQSMSTVFRTRTGSTLGSPAYISPEAARGTQTLDQRADLYSVGILAYELLVGRLPFDVPEGGIYALLQAHIAEPPPAPSIPESRIPPSHRAGDHASAGKGPRQASTQCPLLLERA